MNWKQYLNELIIAVAVVLFAGGWFYKHHQESSQRDQTAQLRQELAEVKRVVGLKKIWGDSKIDRKVEKLKAGLSASKVRWQKRSKKLHATFLNLTGRELDSTVTKILNLPVQIKQLKITKSGNLYTLECTCKW